MLPGLPFCHWPDMLCPWEAPLSPEAQLCPLQLPWVIDMLGLMAGMHG